MSLRTALSFRATAKWVCTGVLFLGVIPHAEAETCLPKDRAKYEKLNCSGRTPTREEDSETECDKLERYNCGIASPSSAATSAANTALDACRVAIDRVSTASEKFNRACTDAGYGSNCRKEMEACDQFFRSDEYQNRGESGDDIIGQLAKQFSGSSSMGVGNNKCPTMAGKDFFRDRKELQSSLKDNAKDLAELKKDIAEVKKDFNTETKRVQEEIQKAQEELKTAQLELKKEQRERAAAQTQEAAKAAAELRKKTNDMLDYRT
ncbi:MAG: hypothetical protein EOP06_28700, partial [Proteobacteria bacterium]